MEQEEQKTPVPGQLTFNVNLQALRENKLFVAVPMYGGMCYGALARSLMELAVLCFRHQIIMKTYFMYNESLVQRARNYCVDEFLRSDCQQFMFIDSDIEFKAEDVIIMMHLQQENKYDILCAPYPKKMIAWEKIKGAVDKGFADQDPNMLENFVGDYVFNALTGQMKINEPGEVFESGTGFMIIRRETFDRFREAYPEKAYKPDHVRTEHFDGTREIHAYFDCEIEPDSKRYLSEDYYFCKYARKAGMKVWLAPFIQLKHNGYYTFGGSVGALAAAGQNITVDEDILKKQKKKN